jgi:predicted dehydrogenase
MDPLRIGLIGYGGFGRFLHQTWEADGAARVVAVASLHDGSEHVPHHGDWRDLVARDDVDLVAVVTPPGTHAEMGEAILDAGKHLLVEKPVAVDLAGADRLIAARDRSAGPAGRPCVAAVDFMLRFNPVVEALVGWGASGAFGPLVRVTVENEAQDASLPAGHWFWDRAQSGGILAEHAVHFLDVVNAVVAAQGGDPGRSAAEGWAMRRADGREDRVLAVVQHAGGPLGTHAHAFTRPGAFERTTMRFTFALAEVDVEGWVPLSGTVRALVSGAAEADLARLPGLVVVRDETWDGGQATVGGEAYPARRHVEGTFAVPVPKPEAYAGALRALLADVRASIDDPGRPVRASLEAGREALRQALAARASADARATGAR